MNISKLKDLSLDGIAIYLKETMDELVEVTEDTVYGVVIMKNDGTAIISQNNDNPGQLCLMILAILQNDVFPTEQSLAIGEIIEEILKKVRENYK